MVITMLLGYKQQRNKMEKQHTLVFLKPFFFFSPFNVMSWYPASRSMVGVPTPRATFDGDVASL